jgi:hypothetical protein
MTLADWLRKRRGSVFGFQSPGYQLAIAAVDRYARLIQLSQLHPEKARRYESEITRIRDALESRIWYLIPYPRYDLTWAELYQLRNEFCQELPLPRVLGELVEEISDDLDYLDATAARAKQAELQEIRSGLLDHLGCPDGTKALALRVRLEALSQLAAQARDAHWLKVNMTRKRLAIMGVALMLVLLGVLLVYGPGLRSGFRRGGDQYERFLWLILMFGAMGGLISAIMDSESVYTRASEYYIYRRLLYLRPLVGAALALVVYLALEARLVTITGIGSNNPGPNHNTDPAYLVIAFASGFAERAFVQQLLKVAGAAGSDQSSTKNANKN